MKIHKVTYGQNVRDVANLYGVDEELLKLLNSIESDNLSEGEELLVLIPTRTYTPRPKDSKEGVAARFGVSQAALIMQNPSLNAGRMPKSLALKYTPHPYGAAATNGYFYKGCSLSELKAMLPYLTYVSFASGELGEGGCSEFFSSSEAVSICKEGGAVPIIKFFGKSCGARVKDSLISEMVSYAKNGGFGGICLDLSDFDALDNTDEFLLALRRAMIGCDLILITEIDRKKHTGLVDYSDGCVIEARADASGGEYKSELEEFSQISESIKTFVELPSFGKVGNEPIPIREAIEEARRMGAKSVFDPDTLLLSFEDKRRGRVSYPSLEYIKAVLDGVNEYGYMGVSFDIMRVPKSFIYTLSTLFKVLKGR